MVKKEELAKFKGVLPENIFSNAQEYIITVTVNGDNVTELYRNNFNKNVNIGDSITITVSNWIYMDANYFYVIGVEMNDVVYLDKVIGLENVVQLMENDKSVF